MSTETLNEIQDVQEDELMLTTIDNPFNPKTEYDMWRRWDHEHGYFTEEYIARLLVMEEDFDVDDELTTHMLLSKVRNEILENDTLEVYRLV